MPQRNLCDSDIKEMVVDKKRKKLIPGTDIPERRQGDRRKAIHSYVEPEFERRLFDRREICRKKSA